VDYFPEDAVKTKKERLADEAAAMQAQTEETSAEKSEEVSEEAPEKEPEEKIEEIPEEEKHENSSDFMPTFSQLFFLLLTYTLEAGSSPTIITARHGSTPQLFRYSTRSRTESSTSAEISFPSISFAILSTLFA